MCTPATSKSGKMGCSGVIFDGDDTLWRTQPLYEAAKEEFFTLMEGLGLCREELRAELERIDVTRVSELGYSRDRFPGSMVATCRHLLRERGAPYRARVLRAVRQIGRQVFEKTAPSIDGAAYTLSALSRRYKLVLATKGDRSVQTRRVKESGLERYFRNVYFLPEKDVAALRTIVREVELDPGRSWAVGNSVRSDILPALGVGLRAVLIPCETWRHEASMEKIPDGVIVLRCIKELLTVL